MHCKKTFTIIPSDAKKIDEIRSAAIKYSNQNILFKNVVHLNKGDKDFDAVALILKTKSKDKSHIKVKFCDETKVCSIKLQSKDSANFNIQSGSIVRIR